MNCSKAWNPKSEIREILKKLNHQITLIRKQNRKILGKRRKRDNRAIEKSREFLQRNKFQAFTSHDLKDFLGTHLAPEIEVPASTVRRMLKEDLQMSFRKINKVNPRVGEPENIREMLEFINLQISLSNLGKTVIYIDEFKFSEIHTHHDSWTKRGSPGHIHAFPIKFQASFIVAVSRNKIHGIMANHKTNNGSVFRYFLNKLA